MHDDKLLLSPEELLAAKETDKKCKKQESFIAGQDTDKFYAMKVIKKRRVFANSQVHHLHQERRLLTEVQHPFIVKLHYAFQTPERLYFLLDYLNGGDLFYHMRKKNRLTEKEARFYACELILALEHLH